MPGIAAGLFLASLVFPYWTVMMRAPTYPEGALVIQVYAHKYEGDVDEWNRVGRLVGVRVPPPIPDIAFQLIPGLIAALAGISLLAAWKERWLTLASILPWFILIGLAAWAQYSLYQFGHNLDPTRPLRYIQPFTPPVIGIVRLGNIRTYHFPHLGSLFFVIGALLNVWAMRLKKRDSQP